MKIFKVLDEKQVASVKSCITKCQWTDGKDSANGEAKNKKSNFQIGGNDRNFQPILDAVIYAHQNRAVEAYTFRRELIDPRVSKYVENDQYDWHVDVAHLANRRTDLSFTIFLSNHTEYDGGELQINDGAMKYTVRGKSGEMIVYPSGLLHKVNKITKGERLVIVGWLNSHIKLEEHRVRLLEFQLELDRLKNLIPINELDNLTRFYYQMARDYSS